MPTLFFFLCIDSKQCKICANYILQYLCKYSKFVQIIFLQQADIKGSKKIFCKIGLDSEIAKCMRKFRQCTLNVFIVYNSFDHNYIDT